MLWLLLIAPVNVWGQELTADDPVSQALALVRAGRYGEAVPYFERALLAAQNTPGAKAGALALLSNELAVAYYHSGQLQQAEVMYRQAIQKQEEADPPEVVRLATILNNLAALYHRQRRLEEAEPLYRRSLELREEALGPEHLDVAFSLNELAMLLNSRNQIEAAIELYERSLKIEEQNLDAENRELAIPLTNLGMLYRRQGQTEEAEQAFRRALAIHQSALGPDHPEVAASINNLAVFYSEQGRFSEAEPLYQRVLEIQTQAFGAEHISIAMGLRNLASLYDRQGLLEKARAMALQATEILEINCNQTAHPSREQQKVCLQATLLNQPLFEKLGLSENMAPALAKAEDPDAGAQGPESTTTAQAVDISPPAKERRSVPVVASGRKIYRAQVRSSKVREDADQELAALRRAQPDLLESLPGRVVRADLGKRGVWYRVQFGEFVDSAAAKDLCSQLVERELTCWVVSTS